MAQEVIGIDIQVNGSAAEKSVGNIRQEIRESQKALIAAQQQFGEYSDEAIAAAKKVAELKDRVQEAAETTALFDPGAKFAAFSGALNAVTGGFAAVQGALGVIGVESEDLQKQLLKVQSALALSEGLSRITDSAKDFKRLGAVLSSFSVIQRANAVANRLAASTMQAFGVSVNATSTSFKVLSGAIAATGIGLLVVGIGTAVNALMEFTSASDRAAEAQKNFNEKTKELADVGLAAEQSYLERTSKLLISEVKARGGTAEEIAKIERDTLVSRFKSLTRYYEEVKNVDSKAQIETLQKLKDLKNEITIFDNNQKAEQLKRQKDADKQRAQQASAAAQKEKDERIQAERDANTELDKLRQEAALAAIKDETERAISAVDNQLKIARDGYQKKIKDEKLLQELIIELEAKAARDRQAIREKAAKDAIANESVLITSIRDAIKRAAELRKEQQEKDAEALIANQSLELEIRRGYADTLAEQRQVELDAINLEFDQRVARAAKTGEDIYLIEQLRTQKVDELNKKSAESEKALSKMRVAAAAEALGAVGQVAGDISKLVGEQTALGKTLAIAQAVIETAVSAQRAYSSTVGIPVVGPFLAPVAAATAVAFGIKNIRTIQQTKIPGGREGGASVPSFGTTAAAPIRPEANAQVVGQELNREAINRAGSATTRAYVVESDVSSAQERSRRLERAARLG